MEDVLRVPCAMRASRWGRWGPSGWSAKRGRSSRRMDDRISRSMFTAVQAHRELRLAQNFVALRGVRILQRQLLHDVAHPEEVPPVQHSASGSVAEIEHGP